VRRRASSAARSRCPSASPARSRRWRGFATSAGERAQVVAAALRQTENRALLARARLHQRRGKLRANRHGEFGRGGRRRRAAVGRMVDQGPVRLVADGRDQRNRAPRSGPHGNLLVKAHQVFERPAAARHDQHVRPGNPAGFRQRVKTVDRRRDLVGRRLALHPDGPDDDADRKSVGKAVEDVANDRSGRGRDDADHLRQERRLPLAGGVEQPFFRELAPGRASSSAMRAPRPASSSCSTTIW